MSKILLVSGKEFDYLNPEDSDYSIEDIAHSLSNLCRFSGHCNKFYSVAEHCVHASYIPYSIKDRFAALLHDAPEFVLLDIVSPLKGLLPDYKELEQQVELAISKKLNYEFPLTPEVKFADTIMYHAEREALFDKPITFSYLPELSQINIKCWKPNKARKKFLKRYNELIKQL